MNFLALCKSTSRNAGIGDNTPSTVVSQSGEQLRVVDWVADAWVEIQNSDERRWGRYWKWMIDTITKDTETSPPGTYVATFTPDSTTAIVLTDEVYIYLTSAGRSTAKRMIWKDWKDYKKAMEFDSETGFPTVITRKPNGDLKIYPAPDASYTIEYDIVHKPITMTANADIPDMPTDYHMAIVWRAVQMQAEHMENGSAYETAERNFQRIFNIMRMVELTDSDITVRPE